MLVRHYLAHGVSHLAHVLTVFTNLFASESHMLWACRRWFGSRQSNLGLHFTMSDIGFIPLELNEFHTEQTAISKMVLYPFVHSQYFMPIQRPRSCYIMRQPRKKTCQVAWQSSCGTWPHSTRTVALIIAAAPDPSGSGTWASACRGQTIPCRQASHAAACGSG